MRILVMLAIASVAVAGDAPAKVDVRPLVDAFRSLREISQVRCTYVVQSQPMEEVKQAGALTLKAEIAIRDAGAHRVTWSAWPPKETLPEGAVQAVLPRTTDVRSTGLSIASIRNQHQVLPEATGAMKIWTFAPFELKQGLEATDERLRGALTITEETSFEVPILQPVQSLLTRLAESDPKGKELNAIPGMIALAISTEAFAKGIAKEVDRRQALADGGIAFRLRDEKGRDENTLWIVLGADPDAGGATVIREVSCGSPEAYKPGFLGTTFAYTTIAAGPNQKPIPLVKRYVYDRERSTLFWELGILVSATVDPKLRDADVAIDASQAKAVFDVATGMERER